VVLLTQEPEASRAAFLRFAKENGAADFMIPSEVQVVDEVPLLGSGKLDFPRVVKLAETLCAPHA
jgi:acyl-[acyl-carrier-protein]-phospholipid O-acyltransferase / long-chain-fatty-acid--[acyl-carrier-protein] ligase